MERLTSQCISGPYREIKASINPATIIKGDKPIIIFIPLLAPSNKDCARVIEPGKRIEFPRVIPAAPAIIMAEISNVPCNQIVSMHTAKYPLNL